ncbi:MAG: glycosyltransferase family 2 protein [Gammaproteobacteria bacterium]|nr:glycosyltransferase family 2 protein [Gammaproteobacteria bacterium]
MNIRSSAEFSNTKTVVLLVNFNTSVHTLRCVESLLGGSIMPSIIVVDNGSEATDYENLLGSERSVVVIRSEENLGFGRGNNLGFDWIFANTDCRYIFVLNNDTYVERDTVQKLESYMESHDDVGACAPRIMLAEDKSKYWYGGGSLNWWRGGGRSWRFMRPFDNDSAERDISFMTGCAMFLRRELLEELVGFDPRFFMYCEDWELSSRIAKSDWHIRYYPEAVLYHEGHASIRGRESGYLSPCNPDNPALAFYLTHVVAGSLLALELSATRVQRVGGVLFLAGRWARWAMRYIWHRRWDAVLAMWRGFVKYHQIRKQPGLEAPRGSGAVSVTLPNS